MWIQVPILLGLFMVGFTQPAHAYLDPGTGSMLLQGIIGGIAAGFAVLSLTWHRIKAKVAGWFGGKQDLTTEK
jgi:hypothetical protein